jgi:4-alpha-glucanotransferase
MLRIDHVMGLHRLFWIPRGMPASEGVYVRYPADELYAVLLLEAQRHGAVVVGEDLGTVPRAVRETMRRRGLWQMYVLPFEVDADRPPRTPAALSVASLNTHDTPPFAAFWSGIDIAQRCRLGLLDPAQAARERSARSATVGALRRFLRETGALGTDELHDVLRACLVYLGRSASRCVLVGLEDLWLETEPQNVPGTSSEYPNWRRRMRCDLDTLMASPQVAEVLGDLSRIRREPGRASA